MHNAKSKKRRGMTLAELLVVVMIMVILMGIALPLMKPALADRKIREASRELNAFLRAAQARAVETNRPCGVWFERTEATNLNISYQMYFAETPPPYIGDTTAARAVFEIVDRWNPPGDTTGTWTKWEGRGFLTESWSAAIAGAGGKLVDVGDTIQFNHSGPYYRITFIQFNSTTSQTEFRFEANSIDIHSIKRSGAPRHLASDMGTPVPKPIPFQILRKPQRSTAGALTLPNTTAVILSLSGFNGVIGHEFDPPPPDEIIHDLNEFTGEWLQNDSMGNPVPATNSAPVVVMFRPDGSVERVYTGGLSGTIPNDPIHFLIGRGDVDERLPATATAATSPSKDAKTIDPLTWQNVNDVRNLWVTISHRTGTITTSPMQDWRVNDNPSDIYNDTLVKKTRSARAFAGSAQSVGGK